MSDRYYDNLWKDAILQIRLLLDIETGKQPCPRLPNERNKKLPISDVYKYFAYLYVRYALVYNKLEKCSSAIVHPQKLFDCRETLHIVMAHLSEIRQKLVVNFPPIFHSCNSDNQDQDPSPWEYVDLNDELKASGITHEEIDICIPRYHDDIDITFLKRRDAIVAGYMNSIRGVEKMFLSLDPVEDDCDDVSTASNDRLTWPRKSSSHHSKTLMHRQRVLKQHENVEAYKKALIDIEHELKNERFLIRQRLIEERTNWITKLIAEGKENPTSLEGFYLEHKIANEDQTNESNSNAEKEMQSDPTQTSQLLLKKLEKQLLQYERVWLNYKVNAYQEQFDYDLAKKEVQERIRLSLIKEVDQYVCERLHKYNLMNAKKKSKGKKGVKKKKKGKKDKKKGKALPGCKISDLKNMDVDEIIANMVENDILKYPQQVSLNNLLGSFDCTGSTGNEHKSSTTPPFPSNPSYAELKNHLAQFCILPNRCRASKQHYSDLIQVHSIMLYGPRGCGKKTAVHSIATELNALIFHLSANNLNGKYMGKYGPTRLIHMIFTVASMHEYCPVVIFLEDCEKFMLNSKNKKKAPKGGPVRFMKDLQTYKNKCLSFKDRVVIVGTSSEPDKIDVKQCKKFFDKILCFPYPNYFDRYLFWKAFLQSRLVTVNIAKKIEEVVDLSSLCKLSEGFTAADIKLSVEKLRKPTLISACNEVNETSMECFLVKALGEINDCDENILKIAEFTNKILSVDTSHDPNCSPSSTDTCNGLGWRLSILRRK